MNKILAIIGVALFTPIVYAAEPPMSANCILEKETVIVIGQNGERKVNSTERVNCKESTTISQAGVLTNCGEYSVYKNVGNRVVEIPVAVCQKGDGSGFHINFPFNN